eukprot:3611402-Rhodomonas_salina.3
MARLRNVSTAQYADNSTIRYARTAHRGTSNSTTRDVSTKHLVVAAAHAICQYRTSRSTRYRTLRSSMAAHAMSVSNRA